MTYLTKIRKSRQSWIFLILQSQNFPCNSTTILGWINGDLQCHFHVFHRSGSGGGQESETGEDVVNEVRRPADGEQDDDGHQHFDNLVLFIFQK